MTEGAASLMTMFYGLHAAGRIRWNAAQIFSIPGSAIYDVYECADGRFISIAPIELKFREVLFERLGLPYTTDDGAGAPRQARNSFSRPEAETIGARCSKALTPASRRSSRWKKRRIIRTMSPAARFVELDDVVQPNAAPRFSRTPSASPDAAATDSARERRSALAAWGIPSERIETLFAGGVIGEPEPSIDGSRRSKAGEISALRGAEPRATARRRGSYSPRRARCAEAVAQSPCRSWIAAAKYARR